MDNAESHYILIISSSVCAIGVRAKYNDWSSARSNYLACGKSPRCPVID
jgi:hypothetical protein